MRMIRARTYKTFTASARATGAASRSSGIHRRDRELRPDAARRAGQRDGEREARRAGHDVDPRRTRAGRHPATARIAMPAAVTNCLTTSVAVTAPRRSWTESGTVSVAATLATTRPAADQ